MRKSILAIAALLALPAQAADKATPPASLDQILALPERKAATCHIEASAAGAFLRDSREAQGGVGAGCDVILANILVGAGARADFAEFRNTGSLYARLGLMLNTGAMVYGLAEWRVPEFKIRDAGQLAIGAGAELKLEVISPNLWLFTEGTIAPSKYGTLATKDDVLVRLGARVRF